MRSADLNIDLIPTLQRMAVGILIECCRRITCQHCELRTGGRCFFDTYSSGRENEPKKVVDNYIK